MREALSLAYDAHTTQKRKSGEPYITHPVEVTRILAELKMDHESLIAGWQALVASCTTMHVWCMHAAQQKFLCAAGNVMFRMIRFVTAA